MILTQTLLTAETELIKHFYIHFSILASKATWEHTDGKAMDGFRPSPHWPREFPLPDTLSPSLRNIPLASLFRGSPLLPAPSVASLWSSSHWLILLAFQVEGPLCCQCNWSKGEFLVLMWEPLQTHSVTRGPHQYPFQEAWERNKALFTGSTITALRE